ncbi:hypothetical protein [Mariniblastus fucicola]|uniref:Uncharacterized protein n=1 Tax=Mariniblastus fucicola TaxID=980251 RepID=A0A5B9P7V0_9BACT|nr:hypothetical protein [Mariniblastus fucicola]QEG20676.1 hypothetical protein MFFC18_05260 [Mariniblastus fucicola]
MLKHQNHSNPPKFIKPMLLKPIVSGLLFAFLTGSIGCHQSESGIDPQPVSKSDEVHSGTDTSSPAVLSQDKSKDAVPEFEFQELEQLSSPFSKKTVLALNEIVARSLATIEAFDDQRRKADDHSERLKIYERLSIQAHQARSDMSAAGKRLRDSGEAYNEAIFNAMVRFVDDVDEEIRAEIDSSLAEPRDTKG